MSRERTRPHRPADDSFDDESILQGYIARLMTMQDEREDWLEETDLTQAARDLGLTNEDLARLETLTEAHQKRGSSFAARGLWDEAIEEYRQATALNPFDTDLVHALSRSYLGRWRTTGDALDREAAERYAHRALQLDPEHTASYEILQELKRRQVRTAAPSQAKANLSLTLLFALISILVVFALFALFLLF
ncbi:MAG: hypothetical protein ACE5G0_06410 [Rhodothermales bacterium]